MINLALELISPIIFLMAIYLLQVKMEITQFLPYSMFLYLGICLDMDMKDLTDAKSTFVVDPLTTRFGQLTKTLHKVIAEDI